SIIYEPVHGVIYKNSKKEKQAMRHSEIHKFCDAKLNRMLEGLKSYNNDVKYGYVQKDLTKDETEYLKLFEEEIEASKAYEKMGDLALEQTQQGVNDEVLVNTYAIRNTKLLSGIEDSHHGPSDAMHNPSQLVKSDTKVLIMTMEILLEPTSNKLYGRRLDKTLKDSPNEPYLGTYQRWKNAIYEESVRKNNQRHQTFEKSSLAMTHKFDDLIGLPKLQPKKTFKEESECEMVMVKMPRCMSRLGSTDAYDEPIGSLGNPMEVEPLDERQLKDLGLNTCNHDIPLSYMEVLNFDEPEPQPNPLPNCPPIDVSLGDERGLERPIKSHNLDSFRMKVVDNLTIHTPPSPHMASFPSKGVYCYYHPCIDDPKKHYGFNPGILGQSGSIGVDFWNLEVIENNFLRGLSLPINKKELEKVLVERQPKKEKKIENNKVVDKNIIELGELNVIESKEEVDMKKEVGDGTNVEPVRNVDEVITGDGIEELVKMPRSQPVGYYLKHEINEKLIEGLIGNQRYNESLLATHLGKMDYETYNSLPVGPMYNAIIKKKITKKEDKGGNFVIPCIVEDVFVKIAGYIYLVDILILDVKEDKKKPFILGTPFLTTAKVEIRFDKGTITLKSGKNKINFLRIPKSLCRVKEGTENNIDLVAPTNTVSRLILEWEERIKLHKEKQMKFNQWRSKVFNDERSVLVNEGCEVSNEEGVT
ncbi:retrovirus-related pol polyprotein from transposon TNT 1-94, partial [Tanacetum coccineum]